jgi:hypothetical protein
MNGMMRGAARETRQSSYAEENGGGMMMACVVH